MLEKIKWSWRVLRSSTFVIATEQSAVCRINVREPYSFDTIVMLAAQYSSLLNFKGKIEDVIKEHEQTANKEFGISAEDFTQVMTRKRKAKKE
jgi:hypothetical protein